MYRTVMEASPESTYWSSSEASQHSASDETPSPLGLRSNSLARRPFEFLEMLSQDCPNHENCQGEIEVWKNQKKNEVLFSVQATAKSVVIRQRLLLTPLVASVVSELYQ